MSLVASMLRIGSRCRDIFRGCPNAHAPNDGQDRGVVTRSADRSASARRCESTASKSDAIRPIRPSCKLHGVGYERSSAEAKNTSEGPGSWGCVLIGPSGSANMTPFNRRRGSVAYRLPPQCWLRRAKSRSIHLELLTGRGQISKPEHQQISPWCLYAYGKKRKRPVHAAIY
jgi:hypothetical protein